MVRIDGKRCEVLGESIRSGSRGCLGQGASGGHLVCFLTSIMQERKK